MFRLAGVNPDVAYSSTHLVVSESYKTISSTLANGVPSSNASKCLSQSGFFNVTRAAGAGACTCSTRARWWMEPHSRNVYAAPSGWLLLSMRESKHSPRPCRAASRGQDALASPIHTADAALELACAYPAGGQRLFGDPCASIPDPRGVTCSTALAFWHHLRYGCYAHLFRLFGLRQRPLHYGMETLTAGGCFPRSLHRCRDFQDHEFTGMYPLALAASTTGSVPHSLRTTPRLPQYRFQLQNLRERPNQLFRRAEFSHGQRCSARGCMRR